MASRKGIGRPACHQKVVFYIKKSHLTSPNFLRDKEGTLHTDKSMDLVRMNPLGHPEH